MEYKTSEKTFAFSKNIRDDCKHCLSFNTLAKRTFGLSFEEWHKAGFWTDKYQPYALLDGGKVVSNVSVNIIDTIWKSSPKRYIQLGTVMTAPECRNMGLSKFLMNRIFDDWLSYCNAVYLYANDSVLNFYPKFGFVKAEEYQATMQAKARNAPVKNLDMANKSDIETLQKFYQKSNPFSELPMTDNWELLMFYCSSFMKNSIYFVADADAVVIAEQDKDILTVFDVYCENTVTLTDVISAIVNVHSARTQVRLGFAPKSATNSDLSLLHEENTTLFVFEGKENIFKNNKTMFPLLSHA